MERTSTTDIPKWSALLEEAIRKPGLIMDAYSAFHAYSIGNQLLALVQCQLRGLEPGPINTFPGWQTLGRNVKRGERALILCMPVTRKRKQETKDETDEETHTYTSFVHKARWFVISQTIGAEFRPALPPQWDEHRALDKLRIERIPFSALDGNIQGFAKRSQIAINPVAQLPHKTLFHEVAHVVLGHTEEANFADGESTPRNLREVEAEAVALICCEALHLEGAEFCRGYIQNWLRQGRTQQSEVIPEKSAQKIFCAADQILRAGREQKEEVN